jgi:CRP-like cAMP-binding protein
MHLLSDAEIAELKALLNKPSKTLADVEQAIILCKHLPFYQSLLSAIDREPQNKTSIVEEIFMQASVVVQKRGAVLIRENDESASRALVLLSGSVGIFRQSSPTEDIGQKIEGAKEEVHQDKRPFIKAFGSFLDYISRGFMFGLDSIITGSVRNSTAICLEESELIVFKREGFNTILKQLSEEYRNKRNDIDRLFPGLLSKYGHKRTIRFVQTFNYIEAKKVPAAHTEPVHHAAARNRD